MVRGRPGSGGGSPARATAPIPQVIHRVWLSDGDHADRMPGTFIGFGDRWDRLHPGWRRVDWRWTEALPPLHDTTRRLIDRAAQIYPDDAKRFVADLVRLELLWRFGGVYVDCDVEPARSIDGLVDGRACVVGRSPQHIGGKHPITNAVIAAVPQHPYIGACIDAAPDAVERYGGRPLAQSVGPWMLTRVYESGVWPTVTVLDADELYGGGWLTHHWNNARRKAGAGMP